MAYAARIHGFKGEVPCIEPQMLGDTNAQNATNIRLTSGRIDPLYYPKTQTATVRSGTLKSIYRFG